MDPEHPQKQYIREPTDLEYLVVAIGCPEKWKQCYACGFKYCLSDENNPDHDLYCEKCTQARIITRSFNPTTYL